MEKEKKEKIVHTALERTVWKRLALIAVEKEVKMSSLIRQAIKEYLEKVGND